MLFSSFWQARKGTPSTAHRRRRGYRPELTRLEDRAVPATVTVDVGPVANFMMFSPATETIHVGDTVHWVWQTDNHSVTSGTVGNPDGKWDSGVHNSGFTFDHTFNQPGTFPYFCVIHGASGMTGDIIVKAGATGGTGGGPTLSIGDVRTADGPATHSVHFIVSLSQHVTKPVTVHFTTVSGTAKAGSDFLTSAGTLTFKPGHTRQTITVKIKGDGPMDATEQFFVKLSHAKGAKLARAQAMGTIVGMGGMKMPM